MKPEVGQTWWLVTGIDGRRNMVPGLIANEINYDVGLPQEVTQFKCINLTTGDSFSAWSSRWSDPVLCNLVGERIA